MEAEGARKTGSSASVYYTKCKPKSKNGGGLGSRLGFPYYRDPLDPSSANDNYSTIHDGGHTYYCQGRLLL